MKLLKLPYKARITHVDPFTVFNEKMDVYEEVIKPSKKGYSTTLRPGNYYLPDNITVGVFKPANLPDLPVPQRFRGSKNLKVRYSLDAPRQGKVNWKEREIILNPQLRHGDPVNRDFVLFHEIGHAHYKNEAFCDMFAAKKCNQKGDSLPKIIDVLQKSRPGSPVTEKVVNVLYKYHQKSLQK